MDECFTPQMHVNYYTSQKGIEIKDIGVAPVAVISWGRSVIQSLAEAIEAQPSPHWFYNDHYLFYTGQVQGQPVSLAQAPIGAPSTIAMMEVMIACGTRVFLGLGWAGSLQPSAPVGTFLIPTGCIREEGTSFHYLDDEVVIKPDQELVTLLQSAIEAEGAKAHTGVLWTTDAPYRETYSKIKTYGQQGVLGVDMETSAMYALGQFREVKVCNLLVVSDELWETWRPAFRTPELKAATRQAQNIIFSCLERVGSKPAN